MSNVTRTTGSTIVSVLSTINATATAVAKIVDSATSSVDMLDAYVQDAKQSQAESIFIDKIHRRRNAILEASVTQEKLEAKISRAYTNNATGAKRFQEIVTSLEEAFTKFDNPE